MIMIIRDESDDREQDHSPDRLNRHVSFHLVSLSLIYRCSFHSIKIIKQKSKGIDGNFHDTRLKLRSLYNNNKIYINGAVKWRPKARVEESLPSNDQAT